MQKTDFVAIKNKIYEEITINGPNFSSALAIKLGVPSLFASALFSELVNEKKLKVSCIKAGESPLYYVEGQETKLENFVGYLTEEQQKAYKLLSVKKLILDDSERVEIRYALRNLKDFVVPLKVRSSDSERLFWKWYKVSNDEVMSTIRKIMIKQVSINEGRKTNFRRKNLKS